MRDMTIPEKEILLSALFVLRDKNYTAYETCLNRNLNSDVIYERIAIINQLVLEIIRAEGILYKPINTVEDL